jgi:uncharacterized protein YjbJ (UPF0337 family)
VIPTGGLHRADRSARIIERAWFYGHARRPLAEQPMSGGIMGINKDQVDGRAKEVGGKIQEEFGKVVGNKTQELKGKVRKNVGAAQANLGDAAEDVKKDLNRRV